MGLQPDLCVLAAGGKIDEFSALAGAVENLDRPRCGSGDHDKLQAAIDRKTLVDAQDDDTATAIVAFMQRELRGR
jgi:hypothetical protein